MPNALELSDSMKSFKNEQKLLVISSHSSLTERHFIYYGCGYTKRRKRKWTVCGFAEVLIQLALHTKGIEHDVNLSWCSPHGLTSQCPAAAVKLCSCAWSSWICWSLWLSCMLRAASRWRSCSWLCQRAWYDTLSSLWSCHSRNRQWRTSSVNAVKSLLEHKFTPPGARVHSWGQALRSHNRCAPVPSGRRRCLPCGPPLGCAGLFACPG